MRIKEKEFEGKRKQACVPDKIKGLEIDEEEEELDEKEEEEEEMEDEELENFRRTKRRVMR